MKVSNGSTSPPHTVLQSQLQKYTVTIKAEFFTTLNFCGFIRRNFVVQINLLHPISHDNCLRAYGGDACNRAPLSSNISSERTLPLCCSFFSNKEPVVQNLITCRCIVYVEFTIRCLCVAFCLYLPNIN